MNSCDHDRKTGRTYGGKTKNAGKTRHLADQRKLPQHQKIALVGGAGQRRSDGGDVAGAPVEAGRKACVTPRLEGTRDTPPSGHRCHPTRDGKRRGRAGTPYTMNSWKFPRSRAAFPVPQEVPAGPGESVRSAGPVYQQLAIRRHRLRTAARKCLRHNALRYHESVRSHDFSTFQPLAPVFHMPSLAIPRERWRWLAALEQPSKPVGNRPRLST